MGKDTDVLVSRDLVEGLLATEVHQHRRYWVTMDESDHEPGSAPDRCVECKRISDVRQALAVEKCTE